jgi:hypothetical protein
MRHACGESTEDELLRGAERCLGRLEALLEQGSPYLLGDRPCALDALVYGYVAVIRAANMPSPWLRGALEGRQKLIRHCERIEKLHFSGTAREQVTHTASPRHIHLFCPSPWSVVALISSHNFAFPAQHTPPPPGIAHSHHVCLLCCCRAQTFQEREMKAIVERQVSSRLKQNIEAVAVAAGAMTLFGLYVVLRAATHHR